MPPARSLPDRRPHATSVPVPAHSGNRRNSPDAPRPSLPRRTTTLRTTACRVAGAPLRRKRVSRSYKVSQCDAHLLRRPKQTILGGLFAGPQNLADVPQLQPLVVPQLENHPLASGQSPQRRLNPLPQLTTQQAPLGVALHPRFLERIHPVQRTIRRFHLRRFLFADLLLPHL